MNSEKLKIFNQLKRSGRLMSKWTIGSQYMTGFADVKNGRGSLLDLYELTDYKIVGEDIYLILTSLNDGLDLQIDQDDRYGFYPLFNKKRQKAVRDTYYALCKRQLIFQNFIAKHMVENYA